MGAALAMEAWYRGEGLEGQGVRATRCGRRRVRHAVVPQLAAAKVAAR